MWRAVVGFAVVPFYMAALLLYAFGLLLGLLATGTFSVGCVLFKTCEWVCGEDGDTC